ncbi:MAG: mechanosensitive ion channel [Saprospiraceae bacterium]
MELKETMEDIKEILEYDFLNIGGYHLNLWLLLKVLIVIVIFRVGLYIIKYILKGFFNRHQNVDTGRQYAIMQFVKYIIYFLAALFVLETVGVKMSAIWAGAAALLVGAGLGLQQAVSDFFSGIVLLSEGTVEVGDVVIVDDIVGKVSKIGLRTSKVQTRDQTTILIPNSKLVMENVQNWSHNRIPARFHVNVGVAYASDVRLVEKILLQAVKEQKGVLKNPPPRVQFVDFGNSSLDFKVFFFSRELMPIEFVKSDIRFRITQLFRENNVEIPFPQRDLWFRNPETFVKPELKEDEDNEPEQA